MHHVLQVLLLKVREGRMARAEDWMTCATIWPVDWALLLSVGLLFCGAKFCVRQCPTEVSEVVSMERHHLSSP